MTGALLAAGLATASPWWVAPHLEVRLPLIDSADPPPRANPAGLEPAGAGRIDLLLGGTATYDDGFEADVDVVTSAYAMAWSDDTRTAAYRVSLASTARWFPVNTRDIEADRFWTGGFALIHASTELNGRYTLPLQVSRVDVGVGLRGVPDRGLALQADVSYGASYDRQDAGLTHGMRLAASIAWR